MTGRVDKEHWGRWGGRKNPVWGLFHSRRKISRELASAFKKKKRGGEIGMLHTLFSPETRTEKIQNAKGGGGEPLL